MPCLVTREVGRKQLLSQISLLILVLRHQSVGHILFPATSGIWVDNPGKVLQGAEGSPRHIETLQQSLGSSLTNLRAQPLFKNIYNMSTLYGTLS